MSHIADQVQHMKPGLDIAAILVWVGHIFGVLASGILTLLSVVYLAIRILETQTCQNWCSKAKTFREKRKKKKK